MNQLKRHPKAGFGVIEPLSPAGTLRFGELIQQSLAPTALFIWLLVMLVIPWRYSMSFLTNIVAAIGALAILFFPLRALFVYVAGVAKTAQNSVARSSAVVFWCYWPCCRFLACVLAIALAVPLGNHLWYTNFRLYEAYWELQSYDNVDSYTITGTRIQDAGLVQFNMSDGVDRARGGCVVNGHTYCVAPIIRGGVVKPGVEQNREGFQDLFMAGIDCCNCPVTDFRCGTWDDPMGHLGGMRLLDEEDRKMYRLAADKWKADWHKETAHDVFFTWANNPVIAWKELWRHGTQVCILACVCAVFASLLLMVILNGVMRLLKDYNIAAPLNDGPPMIPGLAFGLEDPDERKPFVPNQYESYLHQQDLRSADGGAKFVVL